LARMPHRCSTIPGASPQAKIPRPAAQWSDEGILSADDWNLPPAP
jgi:hypothetical protein